MCDEHDGTNAEDVEFEFGDDKEMKEVERILQGKGVQPGLDRDKMQHYASQIKSQIEKGDGRSGGPGWGAF